MKIAWKTIKIDFFKLFYIGIYIFVFEIELFYTTILVIYIIILKYTRIEKHVFEKEIYKSMFLKKKYINVHKYKNDERKMSKTSYFSTFFTIGKKWKISYNVFE